AVQGGRVARRKADPLTSLALAAALILLLRPLDIFSAGFQMSFCAVLGIALLGVPLRRALEWMPEAAKGGLSVTMSAQLGVLPVSAFWFGKISVISLISNLPVIPLAGLLIPVSAMALALHALWPPLGYLLVESAKGLVLLLLLIAKAAARVPFATARVGAFAWYFAAAYFACMLLCSTAVVWRWRARLLCMGALCCLAVGVGALTSYHGVYYVQLDVGQALSGVLHTGRKTYVYDCGNENSDLTEYLLYTGSGVEGLFLSHPHADHVGGLIELLEAGIPVRTVYVPANAVCYGADELYRNLMANVEAHGIPIVEVAAGDVLDLDGLRATVIAPRRDPAGKGDANARSIVLRVKIGDYALLLCGDADVIGSSDVACDVLQVAHHGSRNATDQAFLHSAMPGVALISAGRNNVYGHPHPETLARLESVGADVFQTQEAGALTLYFEDSIRVEAFCR
ncbi:MAG: ComEC/Rec2 family competence protein, partial [Firmicutes bacterium]|nr:ComEC/Rec2 family competence protein [Bacillota bacterium]